MSPIRIMVDVSIDDLIDNMTSEESIEFIKQKDKMIEKWEFTEDITAIFILEMRGRFDTDEEFNNWLEGFKL